MEDNFILESDEGASGGKKRRWAIALFIIGGVVVVLAIGWGVRYWLGSRAPVSQYDTVASVKLSSKEVQLSNEIESQKAEIARLKAESEKKKKNRRIEYDLLYQQLDGAQVANVLQELSFDGIAFKTEQKGKYFNVFVDRDQLEDAKNDLAKKGLPTGGIKGYELFDNASNMGVTDFDKRIRLVRALTGEIEKAILQINGISAANVQIVLPEQRLFSSSQPPVTTAVLIRHDVPISDEKVMSIIALVTGAVEGLEAKNVRVVDTDGHVLSSGLFERIAERKRKHMLRLHGVLNHNSVPSTPIPSVLVPTPSVPSTPPVEMQSRDWMTIKQDFERHLESKVTTQLRTILTNTPYHVAISADMAHIKNGFPTVRRLSISVVIQAPPLSASVSKSKKKQIFSTIAGSTGYVKGRDTIQLTRAWTAKPVPKVVTKNATVTPSVSTASVSHLPLLTGRQILSIGVGIFGVGALVVFIMRRRRSVHQMPFDQNKVEEVDPDIAVYRTELQTVLREHPEKIAAVITDWLSEELKEQSIDR